jgi:hypothetical protein
MRKFATGDYGKKNLPEGRFFGEEIVSLEIKTD